MKKLMATSAIAIALAGSPAFAWDTVAQTPTNVTNAPVANGGNQMQGQHQGQNQAAYGGNQRQGQNTVVSGIGSNSYYTQAPDIGIPSIGGGGNDCPVVGFGVGGSGIGGGGGFGPSWISPDCNSRKLAELLQRLGYRDAAVAVLAEHYPEVKRALETQNTPTPQPIPAASARPDWCSAVTGPAEKAKYRAVCH